MSTLDWALAVAPIALMQVLMVGKLWGADHAGIAGWLAAVLVAALRFGAGWPVLAVALGKSALLAANMLYIIWMALLFYHVVDEAGAITAGAVPWAVEPHDSSYQIKSLG